MTDLLLSIDRYRFPASLRPSVSVNTFIVSAMGVDEWEKRDGRSWGVEGKPNTT